MSEVQGNAWVLVLQLYYASLEAARIGTSLAELLYVFLVPEDFYSVEKVFGEHSPVVFDLVEVFVE